MRSKRFVASALGNVAVASLLPLFLLFSPASAQNTPERTGSVVRGMMTGGIWLELADNGNDQVELAILDGLPGGSPQTRFVSLAAEGEGADCFLGNAQAGVTLSPCVPGGGAAKVTLGKAVGDVAFQDVGWAGSFAWGGAAASVADARARCLMPGIGRIDGLAGSPLGSAVVAMKGAVSRLPESSSDLAASIAELRAERLVAYAGLTLNPEEARAADELEAAIAGRSADGRKVSLSEAARMRQDFERTVNQTPRRVQVRQKLLTIDRQLAEIYDPVDGVRQTMLRGQIRDQLVPALQEGLVQTLANRQPAAIADLLALETAAADIDACAIAVDQRGSLNAREVVQTALAFRIDEVAALVTSSIASAGDSTSARQSLAVFENNAAIMRALVSAGKTKVVMDARARIAAMTASEERARLAGVRAAAAAAAADAIPPTSANGRFSSARVDRSIIYISNQQQRTRGSGFIVAPGIVVTNVHVVGNSPVVYLIPDGRNSRQPGNRFEGQVIARYPIHDIAIVRSPNLPGRILAIAAKEPARGSEVWAVGYPGAADDGITEDAVVASFTRGVISRVVEGYTVQSRGAGVTRLIQHDAQTSGGSSGGAILDNCHRVVGVHAQGNVQARIQESVWVGILPDLLRQAGIKATVAGGSCN